jgi:hypothetical protein
VVFRHSAGDREKVMSVFPHVFHKNVSRETFENVENTEMRENKYGRTKPAKLLVWGIAGCFFFIKSNKSRQENIA